jgi:hypothetical protein
MLSRRLLILLLIGTLTLSEGLSTLLTAVTYRRSPSPTISQRDTTPHDNPEAPGFVEEVLEESSADNLPNSACPSALNALDRHPHTRTQVWARSVWHSPSTPALSNLPKLLI